MGILRLALGEGTTNMKLFVFACLVAMALADAEPKADADPYYGYYGLGYHGLGYGLGYGYGHGLGYAGYYGHGLGHYGYYGKRSADAEPTAVAEAKADADPCTDTTVKCPADSSQPKTSLGITSSSSEKWIAQFGLIPTSATGFSATRLAQARNGEQEAKENQSVLIRRIKKLKPTSLILFSTYSIISLETMCRGDNVSKFKESLLQPM